MSVLTTLQLDVYRLPWSSLRTGEENIGSMWQMSPVNHPLLYGLRPWQVGVIGCCIIGAIGDMIPIYISSSCRGESVSGLGPCPGICSATPKARAYLRNKNNGNRNGDMQMPCGNHNQTNKANGNCAPSPSF